MSIIDLGMKFGRTSITSLLLLVVIGSLSYQNIPKEIFPDINIPVMYTYTGLSGVSPEDSERLLVKPFEKELLAVENLKAMTSTAYQGGANVVLEFPAGFDPDSALEDVKEAVDKAKNDFPDGADDPVVVEITTAQFPVIVAHISGSISEGALQTHAEHISEELEAISEVLEVEINGSRSEFVEVIVNPIQLESYGLQPDQVLGAVAGANQLVAAGSLESDSASFAVKVPGLVENLQDLYNIPLIANSNTAVTLADVATVSRKYSERDSYARLNGKPTLSLSINKRNGVNTIDVVKKSRAAIAEYIATSRAPITVLYTQDQSKEVAVRLADLENNILTSILLVMIVVLGALGGRAGILVGIAIPSSFLIGVFVLDAFLGYSMNIIVLFALIMSVGLLVDGAIVVVEYAEKCLKSGMSPRNAYSQAARRMSWPIIASTATTLAAFAPLLFWPGLVGEFMGFLPATLIVVLTSSLLVALFFVPILGAYAGTLARIAAFLGGIGVGSGIGYGMSSVAGFSDQLTFAFVAVFALAGLTFVQNWLIPRYLADREFDESLEGKEPSFLNAGFNPSDYSFITRGYVGILRVIVGSKLRAGLVLLTAIFVMGASFVYYGQNGRGVEFFPSVEPSQANFLMRARGNFSLDERDRLVRELENVVIDVNKNNEMLAVFSTVTTGEGGGGGDTSPIDTIGTISVEFSDWRFRRTADAIIDEIREKAEPISGVIVEAAASQEGPASGKPIAIEITGDDRKVIEQVTRDIVGELRKDDRIVDVQDSLNLPGIEWVLDFDRSQASLFDANLGTLGSILKLVTQGYNLTTYRPNDSEDEIDVVLRLPESNRTLDQLDNLRLSTSRGEIPVSNFIERNVAPKIGNITRKDRKRIYTVQAGVVPGANANEIITGVKENLANQTFPPGVGVKVTGENEDQMESQAFLIRALIIAIFVMGMILITQFNSFYQALLILSAVLMSTVGVMLGLLVIDKAFGVVMSGIGVIALAGIVVNNNIVLIDTYNALYTRIGNVKEAVILTGAQRLRPVMLTTITTMLGLVALVWESNISIFDRTTEVGGPSAQWWQHLSAAIFFGLGYATILTLFVTPALLVLGGKLLAPKRRISKQLQRFSRSAAAT